MKRLVGLQKPGADDRSSSLHSRANRAGENTAATADPEGLAMYPKRSRYAALTRRTMLRRALGTTAVVLIPGLACSTGDDEIFAALGDGSSGSNQQPTTTAGATATATEEPTAEAPTATEEPTASAGIGTGELVVAFSYERDGSGKPVSPYLAVWVEDADRALLHAMALWFKQSSKGTRWLSDLRRGYSATQTDTAAGEAALDTVSSATRLPGSYSLVWDGTVSSEPVPTGDYFICVESARERGPYSLIRAPLTLTGAGFTQALAGNGELMDASVTVNV